ncbi:hybrid sensor histidine kinase/response regulator [Burkholderia multivorans]|uniref:ATP-binding response regulator n=1 Tax=Burkholderia multivorans TaxID=87883 RepID=UPI000D00EC2C|nr:hybrid sensor histidine kinase/response regulator [Burkholderia multivorans]MBU9180538.1 hybrid sensor histidine kinase/response regulator [Burkholderia multivorans]MCL4664326.1 hybrid sensor histidine kinase/response regulator [Burkholderia multivorans]MCO1355721.1 hybrid sensor histidine kinase/response regulator [Burkholderia multivorans]MCO1416096.1 hybrid sensor histidine kinase/response regulator [Burkholderia multivorans]MCO1450040.1 hybrid sensor histidine kinase/response regulator 
MRPHRLFSIDSTDVAHDAATASVVATALLAVALASALHRLGSLDATVGAVWASYVAGSAAGLAIVAHRDRRSAMRAGDRTVSIACSVAFGVAAGIGWGSAGLHAAAVADAHAQVAVAMATLAVVTAAAPHFSPSTPALLAFVLPATVPGVVAAALSTHAAQRALAPTLLAIAALAGIVALLAHRAIARHGRLRSDAERRAAELQRDRDAAVQRAVELRRQKLRAEAANLAKSRLLAAASHDLRQPSHALGVLVGALRGVPMPADGQRLLQQIELSTRALDTLFGALLDVSRLDAGVVDVHRRPFAIDTVLGRVCNEYLLDAAAKGLRLSRVPCRAIVDSDPVLIERVVRNLVGNAVRYTDAGRIVVGCRYRGARIAIEIHDTGRGIPRDQLELVFREYYRVDGAASDHDGGFGLGLAIVRRLVALLGCRLSVWSEPGRGSCFVVSVPRARTAGGVRRHAAPAAAFVVVVDDTRAVRDAIARRLVRWGYDTLSARSADEAIERLSRCTTRPSVFVSALHLQGTETGIDVIDRLRAEYNLAIPALLIGDASDTAPLADANGCLLLHRPIENGQLRAAIAQLVAAGAPVEAVEAVDG